MTDFKSVSRYNLDRLKKFFLKTFKCATDTPFCTNSLETLSKLKRKMSCLPVSVYNALNKRYEKLYNSNYQEPAIILAEQGRS